MKYAAIIIVLCILTLVFVAAQAPMKKLKCTGDLCVILEKSNINPKPKISQKFNRSHVRYVDIVTKDNTDYLVVKTYSKDIYMKFLYTPHTVFKSKQKLKAELNKFFINIVNSNENVDTKWQRDYGAIQIYLFGQPVFK